MNGNSLIKLYICIRFIKTTMQGKWFYLFGSNYVGVFNDNFLKHAIIFIAVGWTMPSWLNQSQLISLVSAALVIPYIILSPYAGRLSVRYSKWAVFRFFKLLEFPIMALAAFAFWMEWVLIAVFAVLLMGIQSCLYSPAKYGLIRDIGGVDGSAFGSGGFESMAFLGILTGTVAASVLSDFYQWWMLTAAMMLLALLGYLMVLRIRVVEPPRDPAASEGVHLNPLRFLFFSWRLARDFKGVNAAIFNISSFWLIGALLQMNIVIHAGQQYAATNTATGIVMSLAAVGIAAGSLIAGWLSSRIAAKYVVAIGLIGMFINIALVLWFPVNFAAFSVLMFFAAAFGGFYQVPYLASIQRVKAGRQLGRLIAYLNLVIFIFVLLATVVFSVTTSLTGESSFAVFGVILLIISFSVLMYFKYAHSRPSF